MALYLNAILSREVRHVELLLRDGVDVIERADMRQRCPPLMRVRLPPYVVLDAHGRGGVSEELSLALLLGDVVGVDLGVPEVRDGEDSVSTLGKMTSSGTYRRR